MALLFFDGFDHYGTGNNPVTLGKWGVSSGSVDIQTTQFRTGTHSLRLTGVTAKVTTKSYITSGGAVVGFALYLINNSASMDLIQVCEGAITHTMVTIMAGGLLNVSRNGTVLATGTHPLVLNNWYYIELATVIHDTTGSYELRIDGLTELIATNVDTRNGGTGIWDRVIIQSNTSASSNYVDDFYLCDMSGGAPRNTFLGSVKVETLMPQTDAVAVGSNAGLTPSTGTDRGALVDEIPPNTTDFNSASTVGLKDTYNYPPMTLTGTIYGIQTNLYVNKSDAVARQVCAVVRSGGVDSDGANVSPTTTFQYLTEVRPVNTNGGAEWTTAAIAGIEAGMKITV